MPGTHRTARPTCPSPSRTRRSGTPSAPSPLPWEQPRRGHRHQPDPRRGMLASSDWNDQEGVRRDRDEPPGSRRTPDPRRRRRAGRRLAPDGLQRAEQPGPAARRHPRPGAGRGRRARLLAEPGRAQPPHPGLAPHRDALRAGPGGHRQRADGPLRALPGRGVPGGGLPRAAVRGRRRRPGRRVRRAGPLDGGGRVRGDRHLPRQPAGRLAGGQPGAVRRVRPAVGGPGGRPTRGWTSTVPPAARWPRPT